MPRRYVRLLEDAGCRVATFRPLGRWASVGRHNKRNHRPAGGSYAMYTRRVRVAALTPGKIDHNLVRSASR
jgi:hypothetical protein